MEEAKKTTLTRCGKRKREDEPYLPEELIFENIMTRVPVSTLMRCVCVSKHWYKSILDDPHFEISYLAHQSKKDPPFVFYNLNVLVDEKEDSSSKFPNHNYFFRLEKDYDYLSSRKRRYPSGEVDRGIDPLVFEEKLLLESESIRLELVGNCNGLICLSRTSSILILNPSRSKELLTICSPPIIKNNSGYIVCCYGFGFDSLTHQYKVVLLISVKKCEFKCLVFTLGTNSWRETSSSTTIPSPVKTTTATNFYKSAIFCGGALFWRTKPSDNNNMLLLSFDLHDEKFQVIQLPAECASSSLLEEQYQIIDPLLEFKGSPCVARLEKTISRGGGGGGEMCTSTSTSYFYKVHLHILKEYNKVGRPNEQVWIKENFDVFPHSFRDLLSPAAPCFFASVTTTIRDPPNRIMSSSDGRIFLYCFGGGQVLQAYDLQTKRLKYADCSRYTRIFLKQKHSKVYDQIDYHLNGGHIENFMSMLAFMPKGGGAPPKLDLDELISIMNDKQRKQPVVGYFSVQHQKSEDFYLL